MNVRDLVRVGKRPWKRCCGTWILRTTKVLEVHFYWHTPNQRCWTSGSCSSYLKWALTKTCHQKFLVCGKEIKSLSVQYYFEWFPSTPIHDRFKNTQTHTMSVSTPAKKIYTYIYIYIYIYIHIYIYITILPTINMTMEKNTMND